MRFFLLVICLLWLVAACVGSDGPGEEAATADTSQPTQQADSSFRPTPGVAFSPLYTPAIAFSPLRVPTSTATPRPTPTFTVTPTATPATPSPTPVPPPTLLPTVAPAALPGSRHGLRLETVEGLSKFPLVRLTGWEYGVRSSAVGAGPLQWLDGEHLLVFLLTGQVEGMFEPVEEWFPITIGTDTGRIWALPVEYPVSYEPVWSDALQVLIFNTTGGIWLARPNGEVVQRYPAIRGTGINLAPSGLRLWAGTTWYDLETGRMQLFDGGGGAWSSDETRLFTCCYSYVDVNTRRRESFRLGNVNPVGRGGVFWLLYVTAAMRSQWVLDDTRVMVEWDFAEEPPEEALARRGILPLIDPVAQTYEDVRSLVGFDPELKCGAPLIAPRGEHIWVRCTAQDPLHQSQATPYLINLRTFIAHEYPLELGFLNWSPDGRFALLAQDLDLATRHGGYWLLSLYDASLRSVAEERVVAPAWSPSGDALAFLSTDGRTLNLLALGADELMQVPLQQPSTQAVWRPQEDALAILGEDGALWWLPDLAATAVKQMTSPLPGVRDVAWSPDGERLAFVGEKDVYIVSIYAER